MERINILGKTSSHQGGRTPARNIINIGPGPATAAKEASADQECFNLFITNEMINIIVLHANKEIRSKKNCYKIMKSTISETCMEEIKALFGILIKTVALKDNHLTAVEMWDNLNGRIWCKAIMSRDRFNFLINCLRFDVKSTRLERKKLTFLLLQERFGKISFKSVKLTITLLNFAL